jgi:acetate kinase
VEAGGAPVAVLVVPADEEREIAEQALRCVEVRARG